MPKLLGLYKLGIIVIRATHFAYHANNSATNILQNPKKLVKTRKITLLYVQ